MSRRVSAWAPAATWAIFIFWMSTASLSADNTGAILRPIVLFFVPSLSDEAFELIHFVVRKLAHFSEYAVFALLLDRGFRLGSSLAPSRAPLAALAVAVLYALTDEAHQAFVPDRTPSLRDCAVDAVGALCVAVGLLLVRRARPTSASLGAPLAP